MKSLKTILGIALSVGGLGTAATVAGVSIAQNEKAVVDSVVEASVTNNTYRLNFLVESSNWKQDGVSMVIQFDGNGLRQCSRDTDFAASTNNSNYSSVKIGNTTYDWITLEMSSSVRNGITYDNPLLGRGTVSNHFNDFNPSFNIKNNFKNNTWDNTIKIQGSWNNFSSTNFGWYNKVAIHTGLDHSSVSYTLLNLGSSPSNPSAIFGYDFEGWYTDEDCTESWDPDKQYTDVNLYANYTPKKEAYLASSLNDWKANDDNYLLSPAENSQYYIDVSLEKDEEFKIVYNGSWKGWEEVDDNSKAVGKYIVQGSGTNIKAATAGQYEIYFKTTGTDPKIWIQQDSTAAATTWAQSFLDATDLICSVGGTGADHLDALSGIWSTHSDNYDDLTIGAQGLLKIGTANATIADAHDRYVHIMTRYAGQLSAFGDWTVGGSGSGANAINAINNNNTGIIIAVVSTVTIAVATGAFFLLRKKRFEK